MSVLKIVNPLMMVNDDDSSSRIQQTERAAIYKIRSFSPFLLSFFRSHLPLPVFKLNYSCVYVVLYVLCIYTAIYVNAIVGRRRDHIQIARAVFSGAISLKRNIKQL